MKTVPTKPYSVLITDDELGSREALRDLVEPEGYRTVLASSGEEAVDIVREEPVHLALLDMHMPRLTGLETLELMRQVNQVLPCILITGDATEDVMRQAFRARCQAAQPPRDPADLRAVARMVGAGQAIRLAAAPAEVRHDAAPARIPDCRHERDGAAGAGQSDPPHHLERKRKTVGAQAVRFAGADCRLSRTRLNH